MKTDYILSFLENNIEIRHIENLELIGEKLNLKLTENNPCFSGKPFAIN